jgi:hypothetical protein
LPWMAAGDIAVAAGVDDGEKQGMWYVSMVSQQILE